MSLLQTVSIGIILLCSSIVSRPDPDSLQTAECKNSDFVSISPTSLRAGDATRITIKFRNNGTCIWKKGTVKLYAAMTYKPESAQWTDGIKRKFGLVDDFPGYVITQDIPVNGVATFTFVVDAFPSAGKYTIKYRLIKRPGVDDFFGEEKRVNFEVKK
ncbi:MAG: hypothetical protein KAX45_01595 [Chitinophagaceae bacterium]|nr:hypothetical protein [Chitinophagaceae bacterium]MBP6589775.1 hypothetical protein [Chitinophagaceae bacterium]MBP8243206.1 hypothetical protein [Chitinophagaceae bacterium]